MSKTLKLYWLAVLLIGSLPWLCCREMKAGEPPRRILSASQARREAFAPRPRGMPRAAATNKALFSVCPDGTATDYKTGTPTITITHDGDHAVAVLSVAQTGDIGVGMRIDYDSGGTPKKCWIASVRRTGLEDIGDPEDTFWVVTATGGQVATCAGLTVDSIKHEYASLSAFEAGFTDANHINDTDLENADVRVWACLYDGTADDTTGVTLNWGGTQTADCNLIVYTPFESDEVVLESQRHSGVWTADAYRMVISAGELIIDVEEAYTWVEGVQIEHASSSNDIDLIYITVGYCRVANCLMGQTGEGSDSIGIFINCTDADGTGFLVFNNIIYANPPEYLNVGITVISKDAERSTRLYNNTVYNCLISGIVVSGTNDVLAINNLSYDNDTYDFYASGGGSFHTNSDYNFSYDDTAPGGNSIHGGSDFKTPDFVSTTAGSENLHLLATSDAIDVGSSAPDTYFDYDIDNKDRPISKVWDMGADEKTSVRVYEYDMYQFLEGQNALLRGLRRHEKFAILTTRRRVCGLLLAA